MNVPKLARIGLLIVQAFVAITAFAGGVALILGATSPTLATVLSPPTDYLDGSPFASYLVPGVLLAGLLGGVHAVAFFLLLKRTAWQFVGSAAAAFAMLIWVFVQMVFIPFSFLQAVYFAIGIAEIGLLMLMLGIVGVRQPMRPSLGVGE
jgi:hypothetical protein